MEFPLGAAVDPVELDADPHPILARLRASEPVSWLPALDGWLVTSYDVAVDVMRDSVSFTVDDPRFSTARVVGTSMLSLDGAAHTRHRAPFVAPFRPAQVTARFGGEVEALTRGLLDGLTDRLASGGEVDLRTELAGPLSVAVVASVLGLAASDAGLVLGWYATIVDAVSSARPDVPVPPSAEDAMTGLAGHVLAGLDTDAPGSLLATAARSLETKHVVANAAVLMFGGIETTEGMILNVLSHLLDGDVDAARLVTDPGLVAAAVEESLRLEPAAAVVDRYATRDVEVAGARIAAGDLVRVSLTGANRDPRVFTDPDEFDPRRANVRAQLSFAKGPHVCVAMDLARLEARVALRELAARTPGLRRSRPAYARGLVFRKPPSMWVRWL